MLQIRALAIRELEVRAFPRPGGRWGHPVASMCRLLLARSFDGDITGPESTDSLVLQRGFLITNMTIPENTVTIAALVVESCAGGFFQAGAFAVP